MSTQAAEVSTAVAMMRAVLNGDTAAQQALLATTDLESLVIELAAVANSFGVHLAEICGLDLDDDLLAEFQTWMRQNPEGIER